MPSLTSTTEVILEANAAQNGCIPGTSSLTEARKIETRNARGTLEQIKFHAYTLWLFTVSDLSTTLVQTVLFGVAGASSGRLTTPPSDPSTALSMVVKLPVLVLYPWLMMLYFQLDNQSTPAATAEDRLNKPWRPIPAGRVSRAQAHSLVGPMMLLTLTAGFALGLYPEAALFAAATSAYCQFGGAEVLGLRHAANGMFFATGGQAALKIAAWPATLNAAGHAWSGALFWLITTTIQAMDFRDQAGDAAIGRQTLPLVMGDAAARWVTIVPMLFWTILCPWLCGSGLLGYGLCAATAGVVVSNLVVYRTVSADRRTYKLWSVWLAVIFATPWLALLP